MNIEKVLVDQFSQGAAKIIIENIYNWKNNLQKFTIPIYCEWGNDNLTLVGSGILIKILDNYILLTAAHVIDETEKGNLAIPSEQDLTGLDGFYCSSIPIGKTRDDDNYDIAFAFLAPSTIQGLLTNYQFLEFSKLFIDNITFPVRLLSFIGYPASKNKTDYRIKPYPHMHTNSELNKEKYSEYKINTHFKLASSYNAKRTSTQSGVIVQFPDPHGLSGGGIFIWEIDDNSKVGNYRVEPYLAGIITDRTKDKKIWIGSNIKVALQGIRNNSLTLKNIIPDFSNYDHDFILKNRSI